MLIYWLQSHSTATWHDLIEALKAPGVDLNNVANIVEVLFPGQYQEGHLSRNIIHQEAQGNGHTGQQTAESSVINFSQFESVTEAFVTLTSKLTRLLRKADFHIIRRSCIEQINTPNGAQLPPRDVSAIKSSKNIDELLDVLASSAYWSWIDVRLLQAMVTASDNTSAIMYIKNYKSAVFKKKLKDILPDAPSKEIKDAYYTKVVSKFNEDADDITVEDLLKLQSQLEAVIMDIKKGVCILEHLEKGCIEIFWYIPASCVDGAYRSARAKQYQFNDLHLQSLKIGHYPVVHNPLALPDLLPTPSPPVNAASVKDLINHYYDYLSVNMDAGVVTQLMVSQQLPSEDNVMAASSDYHKNCLILQQLRLMNVESLESFSELLLTNDCQKHIGTMLTEGLQSSLISSSSDAQSVVDQVITTTKHNEQKDKKKFAAKHDMMDPSSVIAEFLNMKDQLEELLEQCSPIAVTQKCISLLASDTHNIPLFPNDYTGKLQDIKQTVELIQKFSPLMTWDNHSILTTIAETSNISEASMIVTEFDSRIDSSQPLTSFPIPAPSYLMVPYDNGTYTVLAVKLDLELHLSTLQTVIDARCLIQDQCKLTPHCLQLLAVAKTTYTMVYWMIPKTIAHLVTANAVQYQNYYKQKGILQLAVYPGAMLCTGSTLKVGPLSFFNHTEISKQEKIKSPGEDLNSELSQLEELPQIFRKLHKELAVVTKHEALKGETEKSSEDPAQNELQLKESKALEVLLQEKVTKEKQKYSDLLGKYEDLQNSLSLGSEIHYGSLQEKIIKEKQKYSDLQGKYEELVKSISFDSGIQTELSKLQVTMETVTICLEKVEVIKNYWSDKITKSSELPSKEGEGVKKLTEDVLSLVTKLQELNTSLTNIKDWSAVMQLLQTELSDSKQRVDQLESELSGSKEKTESQLTNLQEHINWLETQLQSIQEENKVTSNELSARLMMKEKELMKLKEDNKLLVKLFRERKEKKIRETIPQDQLIQQELIGNGRYGEVYKISYSDKFYAGKIIYKKLLQGYPQFSVDQMNKLIEEIENASTMLVTNQHPNVEQFHSVFQVTFDSPPVLLTELLHENLNNYIARMKGKLPIHAQLDLCHDMAKGLQFLHTAGLVHNNLHGANVLISKDGLAKIADYICPLVDSINEQATPQDKVYMSPESIKNTNLVSKHSDIYSLGVLYLQVSTQSRPMPKDSIELSEVQCWKEQLDQIATNPLLPLILNCLNMIFVRPTIDRVCVKICVAKESPQSVMSNTLYQIKDTTEFGAALQSGRYKLKWTKFSNLPVAMKHGKVIVINDILYIGGGICTTANDEYYMFSYQLTDDQWTKLPILPYCNGVPINIDNQLSYIGGYDPFAARSTNKVITLEDNKWTAKYHNMIVARYNHAAVTYQHYIIVAGGLGEDWSTLDTIEVFNCNNYQWTIVSTHLPQPMKFINATTCNQSFIIAGYDDADDAIYSWTFIISMDSLLEHQQSPTTSTSEDDYKWSKLCHTPYFRSTIVPNTSPPVIIGGEDRQRKAVNNISSYDDSSNSWKTIELSPITCARAAVTTINNTIIIAGGYTDDSRLDATTLTSVVLGQLQLCN